MIKKAHVARTWVIVFSLLLARQNTCCFRLDISFDVVSPSLCVPRPLNMNQARTSQPLHTLTCQPPIGVPLPTDMHPSPKATWQQTTWFLWPEVCFPSHSHPFYPRFAQCDLRLYDITAVFVSRPSASPPFRRNKLTETSGVLQRCRVDSPDPRLTVHGAGAASHTAAR